MARISLVICDWCKKNFEEPSLQNSVVLNRSDGKTKKFEVCKECLSNIKSRMENSIAGQVYSKVYNSNEKLSNAIARIETKVKELNHTPVEIQDITPPGEPTDELLDGELQRIPSTFRQPTRAEIANAEKLAGCPHHFKSFNGSFAICVDAPENMRGPLATFHGCGKKLSDKEL